MPGESCSSPASPGKRIARALTDPFLDTTDASLEPKDSTDSTFRLLKSRGGVNMRGGDSPIPPEGITAEVIVVASFDELHKRAQEAKGKIVVYNEPFISYGETVRYRSQGAVEAAKVGAVASLIRSIASFSIHSPHTGWQDYHPDVPRIPTACISVEDAEMMSRMSLRGTKIVVHLKMGAKTYPDSPSFNTVAEIVGSKYPEQIVLVSGHLDSWDVGQGAMDDGGGAFISWEALSIIKDLGLRPKRTLRLVLWTAEEQGGIGAEQYYELHKYKPEALVLQLGGSGFPVQRLAPAERQRASLRDDLSKYFWFHHSQGDTMTVQDPNQMNLCAAVWTVVSYVIADMEEMLPSDSQLKKESKQNPTVSLLLQPFEAGAFVEPQQQPGNNRNCSMVVSSLESRVSLWATSGTSGNETGYQGPGHLLGMGCSLLHATHHGAVGLRLEVGASLVGACDDHLPLAEPGFISVV
ncbi:carboxypeptidase q [Limosa lapponica baueri]|uniref:Carboxypeptidase Q n=1 Tax=Limosa lapponica baueri TaxID=1758121 RepID=A0A2I0U7Y5_LIMLA|nr:carboxypeptidase q [Limosa lapponica baueri]